MGTIPAGVQPGDFFCTFTASEVSRLVAIGEWLNGDRFARTKGRQFSHSGVVTAVAPSGKAGVSPLLTIVEAEPGGVRRTGWHYGPGCVVVWSTGVMDPPDRPAVVAAAESKIGERYGWLNYPAIGLCRLGLPAQLAQWTPGVICSQLTDVSERAGGLVIIPGKPPQLVTPQQIADELLARGARPMHG